jgi:hypothetical protein
MSKSIKYKSNKDPAYLIRTVKLVFDNGVLQTVRKDKGIQLIVIGSIGTTILPTYETAKRR